MPSKIIQIAVTSDYDDSHSLYALTESGEIYVRETVSGVWKSDGWKVVSLPNHDQDKGSSSNRSTEGDCIV